MISLPIPTPHFRPPRQFAAACAVIAIALSCVTVSVQAAAPATNQLEDLTWKEVRARIDAGATTVLVPIGGTEQSGPYIVLGKHNVRARLLAGMLARQLGNALVAPVIAYVPEGAITPPAGHMRYAGTISIPDSAFEALLEGTARSFRQHGFRDVVFIGDHGGYQKNEQHVAARLNREWAKNPACRVHALPEFYQASQAGFAATLKSRGYGAAEIGVHAGLADTALSLGLDPALVRADALAHAPKPAGGDGIDGDPRRATRALGELGVQQIVAASVAAIRAATAQPR